MLCRSRARAVLLALLVPVLAPAQGFNSYSGRNHPELRWRVAETEHFEIMYPQRLAGIEAEAAPIAEATYDALSTNLGVTFDRKIRVYLSDEDDVTNGFAVPIGDAYTDIWVHVTDWAGIWTGREKWLRKVLAHELAHIFHFRATRSNVGNLDVFFGEALPRFWTEGLAQYQTESWDAQRGDRWLRMAVLDDNLSYRDPRTIYNGRLLYALGNSQVRYFAETYGDTTLARLLAHRDTTLFGLVRHHDFGSALEETVDLNYRAFYDDWRRHVNVYYNALAAQMEPPDSLGVDPLNLPGQYLYDIAYSPDTARVAVVALTSLERPVRRLYVGDREEQRVRVVAEGAIQAPVAWSPDGTRLVFAREGRGRYGSIVNDLWIVDADGGGLRRLTRSRRAGAPTFTPDGQSLAYAATTGGTSNIFLLDLETGEERPLTRYTGDVQLSGLAWHPTAPDTLAFARFAADGTRDVVLLNTEAGEATSVTSGVHDDRLPVWKPDGTALAYTSLRDRIPNVFVYSLATGRHRRATHLVTGATAVDWLPPDSLWAAGTLAVIAGEDKARDRAYRIDAARRAPAGFVRVPDAYSAWTAHRPPETIPSAFTPEPDLITARRPYNSWANLSHALSFAVPYYSTPDDWGVIGTTTWIEPLGKHSIAVAGALSIPQPLDESFLAATYNNNQLRPSLFFSLYRIPGTSRIYGDTFPGDFLVEAVTGGDVTALWPLDWRHRPYTSTRLELRVRVADFEPLNPEDFVDLPANLPPPEAGQQADVRVALQRTFQRPYRYNLIHPLDGRGVRAEATAAARLLGADTEFVRGDVAAYTVLPSIGRHRFFLYGRAQAQTGTAFAQDYLGLSRYDDLQFNIPGFVPFVLGNAERVRGYRSYALGTRVLFGSAEYRSPLVSDLQTRILGVVELGPLTGALFADAGLVWSENTWDDRIERVGVGGELKNQITVLGIPFVHAVGAAQPLDGFAFGDFERTDTFDLYYRIRAVLPF